MKLSVFGSRADEIKPLIEKMGFEITPDAPDVVVSYGGDGTLMAAEYEFPGVPKLILRASLVCKKCPPYSNDKILELFKDGKYQTEELVKLEAISKNRKLLGINDIVVHNAEPRSAIRYRYSINGIEHPHEVIGDGAIIATPFGSSAYYRSITKSTFQNGMGLAFNNSTEPFDHIVLKEDGVVELDIVRGPAIAFADNQGQEIALDEKDTIQIKKSSEVAKILVF